LREALAGRDAEIARQSAELERVSAALGLRLPGAGHGDGAGAAEGDREGPAVERVPGDAVHGAVRRGAEHELAGDGLARHGAQIAPGTLAGACAQAGALLAPLEDAIAERSRGSWHLHADETTWRVFAPRDGNGPAKWRRRTWVFLGADTACFVMDATRSGAVLARHAGIDGKPGSSPRMRMSRIAPCGRVEAQVLHRMGEANLRAGDLAEAIVVFKLALANTRDLNDPIGEAYALMGVGVAETRRGEFGSARDVLQRALKLAGTVGERLAEARALLGLSELCLASGDPSQAVVYGEGSVDVFLGIGALLDAARAFTMLGDAHFALGATEAANEAMAEAATLTSKTGR
jgi:Transposase IS66 family/Tetratricopeptide repeat